MNMTISPYLEKQDQNTVNLKRTDPLQSAALSNLKPVSYKNQLQGQDVVQPKSTGHKVRARNLALDKYFYVSLTITKGLSFVLLSNYGSFLNVEIVGTDPLKTIITANTYKALKNTVRDVLCKSKLPTFYR